MDIPKVLYVDDEQGLLEIAKLYLEDHSDIQVDTEQFSLNALERISATSYDAIVSDYQMPRMDGLELLKALRASGDRTPFILFTGRGREEVAIEALNSGADFYLQKGGDPSVQFAELKNAVIQLAHRKNAERQVICTEQKYRDLVESANSIILKCDRAGNILFLNAYGMKFFGCTQDVVGQPVLGTLLRPEDYPDLDMADYFGSFLVSGLDSESYTLPIKHGDEVSWISMIINAVRGVDNEVTEFLAIGNDVTAIKDAESKLQHTTSALRAALDASDEGILVVGNDRAVTEYNQRYLDLWHIPSSIMALGSGKALVDYKRAQLKDPESFVRHIEDCHRAPDEEGRSVIELKDGRIFEVHSIPKRIGEETVGRYWSFKDISETRRTKRLLERSELRHNRILDSISEGVIVIDENNRIIHANDRAAAVLRLPLEKIIGKDPRDFVSFESMAALSANLAKRKNGEKGQVDYKLKRGEGTEFWATVHANPIHTDGVFEGSIYALTDITERKEAEMALQESEERFRHLIEKSPHAIVIVRNSRSIYVNSCCARMLGYHSSDDLLGRPVLGLFAPQYHELIADSIIPGEQDAEPSPEHESVMLRNGCDLIPVSLTRTRVNLSDGQAVVLVIDDLSGKKKIEEAFREKEHFVDRVLSTDPSGILVYDIPSDRIVYVNDKVEKVTGKKLDQIKGMPNVMQSMVHPGDLRALAEATFEIINGRDDEVHEAEVRIRDSDSEWRWVHFFGTPFTRNERGKVVQTISGMLDITDRKRAEGEAAKALKKLDLLAGITGHDISNQVVAILANVELGRRSETGAAALDRLERIERSARTINSHIEFSKNYQKMGTLPPQWQNVAQVVQDLDIRDEIAGLEISEEVRGLSVDADQMLKNVFHNLLEDSLRYAGRPTRVRLSCALIGSALRLTYEDVGPGIPYADKNRIFEKGYGRGTGFGLFLSREVLALTGIKIEENGIPGKGARFDILIPHGGFELCDHRIVHGSRSVPEQITD